jgi:hypothetical protein
METSNPTAWQKFIYVSEGSATSFFMTEEYAKQAAGTPLNARLVYFLIMNMDIVHSPETSVGFYQTTQHHMPED